MRFAVCLLMLVSAAGCAVVPPQAWTFDPTQPQPKAGLEPAQATALSDRVAQLQLRRHEIRARIATEPDVWKRQDHYAQLHAIGRELSPLERRLSQAAAR